MPPEALLAGACQIVESFQGAKTKQLDILARRVFRPGAWMLFVLTLAAMALVGVAMHAGHDDLARDFFTHTLTVGLALVLSFKRKTEE